MLDPDEEVREAVALVFRWFREAGSALAVVHRFTLSALRFPNRAFGGARNSKLIWGKLTHCRVLAILKDPAYAGMYVYGRYQYRRQISSSGEVRQKVCMAAFADWRVRLGDHHEGYISREQYRENQERILASHGGPSE